MKLTTLLLSTGLATGFFTEVDASSLTANQYLQQGHTKKNEGKLDQAIELYEKALKLEPGFEAAKLSLETAEHLKQVKNFSTSLPAACQTKLSFSGTLRQENLQAAFKCTQNHFVFNGSPINPMIIKDLSTWTSDGGNQVLEINLPESQNSNKYFTKTYSISGTFPHYSISTDIYDGEGSFSYSVIGVTDNNIWVIETVENGGGTGYFYHLLFLRVSEKKEYLLSKSTNTLSPAGLTIVLQKLHELPLGDRVSPDITIKGNEVSVRTEEYLTRNQTTQTYNLKL